MTENYLPLSTSLCESFEENNLFPQNETEDFWDSKHSKSKRQRIQTELENSRNWFPKIEELEPETQEKRANAIKKSTQYLLVCEKLGQEQSVTQVVVEEWLEQNKLQSEVSECAYRPEEFTNKFHLYVRLAKQRSLHILKKCHPSINIYQWYFKPGAKRMFHEAQKAGLLSFKSQTINRNRSQEKRQTNKENKQSGKKGKRQNSESLESSFEDIESISKKIKLSRTKTCELSQISNQDDYAFIREKIENMKISIDMKKYLLEICRNGEAFLKVKKQISKDVLVEFVEFFNTNNAKKN